LQDQVDIVGASGTRYRFMRLRDGRPLSPMGGNYLFGRHTGSRFEIIYAGEAQNLLRESQDRWNEARERFQVSDLYTRLNISERVRKLEHADILEGSAPPMNEEPRLRVAS